MTGVDLKSARLAAGRTQLDAANKLGVTQAYVSMLERGERGVPEKLALRVVTTFKLPPTLLPPTVRSATPDSNWFKQALGRLGYPGFVYLRGAIKINPAALLLRALDTEDLDSRVVEVLPWVALTFPSLDWGWLTSNARLRDRQNRLGFVVSLASAAAVRANADALASTLAAQLPALEKSRLAAEDTLCKQQMTVAERRWLRTHRSVLAEHWNLLSDLSVEQMDHVFA